MATSVAFIVLTVVMYVLVLALLKHVLNRTDWDENRKKSLHRRVTLTLLGWGILICLLAAFGVLGNFSSFPPPMAIVLVVPLVVSLLVTFSKSLGALIPFVEPSEIIRLQVFRLFVEILLWLLYIQQLLPTQMTFEGRNFDVLTGLTAPLVAFAFGKNKTVMIGWNMICLGLLANIVAIAVLSMPTPFRIFLNEPPNTIVSTFPFVLLPGLLVPLAYTLHFISLRQLLRR